MARSYYVVASLLLVIVEMPFALLVVAIPFVTSIFYIIVPFVSSSDALAPSSSFFPSSNAMSY